MIKIDPTDKRLIELLQADAKQSIKEISTALRLTKTPVYDRIKRLERAGVIQKYVAVVDPKKITHTIVVFCSVSLESQRLKDITSFSRAIEKIPEVIECYLMGGANDFLLKVMVEDLEAYHRFSSGKLAALPNVSQIKSTFVLDVIKRSTVIPMY